MQIEIIVRDKIAHIVDKHAFAVCGNSDYVIEFDFDPEWDVYEAKTARFKYNDVYEDVLFKGNKCPMPIINDTVITYIGVYAGDIKTTTSAILPMRRSILCGTGFPADPSPDVYAQIMKLLNEIKEGEISPEDIQKAVNQYLTEHPVTINPADKENIGGVIVGDNLNVTDKGLLSAEIGEEDFTEITNLEVETIISNIGGI